LREGEITKDIYRQIGIYRITNRNDGKSYIGKTGMNFGDRWDSHRSLLKSGKHTNPNLQSAWSKDGEDAFEFSVIESVESPDILSELEIKYIAEFRKMDLSYNLHDGGDSGYFLGRHLSAETKKKIGDKNRVNMIGRKASEATRKKMSLSQSKRYAEWSDEDRKRHGEISSKCASGYKWSDESRAEFSRRQRQCPNGAKFTPDDIRDIRTKRDAGCKLTELAECYNTSPSYISNIVHRRRWADI
jgi:group I intron endonuclease